MVEVTTGKGAKGGRAFSRRHNRPGPRERLLASTITLFTTGGIRIVGIDRILREADVTRASLCPLSGSKDKLVVAYLRDPDAKWQEAWEQRVASLDTPAEKTFAFLDQCIAEQPAIDFRGSHFQDAASEYPRSETESEQDIRQAATDYCSRVWQQLHTLLTENESSMPSTHANMLLPHPDGGLAGAKMSKDLNPLQMVYDLARDLVA